MNHLANAVALLALFALPAMAAEEFELPAGWRYPTSDELGDDARSKSPERLAKAIADFNADGIEDVALLLKSKKFSGEALWVRLSNGPSSFTWLKLNEIRWGKEYPAVDLSMGIDVAPPGIYPFGCFDDAKGECNFGPHSDRPKLKLRDSSLAYFKPESSASLFFWSNKYQRFMRVWLSD